MNKVRSDSANPPAVSEGPSVQTYLTRLMSEPSLLATRLAKDLGVDPATVTRWMLVGVRGRAVSGIRPTHKLEHYKIGGRLYTSKPAWERFVAAQNNHVKAPTGALTDRTDTSRRVASESAAKQAEALGY